MFKERVAGGIGRLQGYHGLPDEKPYEKTADRMHVLEKMLSPQQKSAAQQPPDSRRMIKYIMLKIRKSWGERELLIVASGKAGR